ncbi:MAG: YeiH family protein [Gammaproteobacteria bacterium]
MAEWLPGVVLTALLAVVSGSAASIPKLQANGISSLTIAMLLGMAIGSVPRARGLSQGAGVQFSKQFLLRLGIVLYGFRITFHDVAAIGVAGVVIDGLVLVSTFALAWLIGTRWCGLDREAAMLIGAGSAICGAAAVMAAAPIVRGRAEQVALAVSTVVLFGTLSMILYPVLYEFALVHLPGTISPRIYGVFAGSTIHEVAQVVAAGHAVGESAASAAVITKMVRVMMLAPFLVVLSAYLEKARRRAARASSEPNTPSAEESERSVTVAWFAFGFIAIVALNSLLPLSAAASAAMATADTFILAMAMAALGLCTKLDALAKGGARSLALAALLFTWLIGGGTIINLTVWSIFGT